MDGPVDPLVLAKALVIIETLPELRPTTLCGAWLVAKGMNGDSPESVHQVLAALGDQTAAILDHPTDHLGELLSKLRRRHYPIETAVFALSN